VPRFDSDDDKQQNQGLAEMTDRKSRQEAADQGTPTGMFIGDAEIIEKHSADVIAVLDEDPHTQKDKATRPAGARFRPAVEKKLAAHTQP
jgi:hypothetical protein